MKYERIEWNMEEKNEIQKNRMKYKIIEWNMK